jgi:regulator of cell morphogenesis and NO signaling
MKKEKTPVNNCNQIDPILLLMQEHEEGIKYLKRLGKAADYIHSNGFSFEAFKDVAEAIRFIDNEIRRHNEKEEKYLFPLLASHASEPVEPMRDEHRELWKAFKYLRECVKEVEEMKIYPTTVRDLVRLSKSIVDLLTNHITKENEVLFPLAKSVLTKDEYALLTREINAAPSIILHQSIS